MLRRPNHWLCGRCRAWHPFPPPSDPAGYEPWLCLNCLRAQALDVESVARRILALAGVL